MKLLGREEAQWGSAGGRRFETFGGFERCGTGQALAHDKDRTGRDEDHEDPKDQVTRVGKPSADQGFSNSENIERRLSKTSKYQRQ